MGIIVSVSGDYGTLSVLAKTAKETVAFAYARDDIIQQSEKVLLRRSWCRTSKEMATEPMDC